MPASLNTHIHCHVCGSIQPLVVERPARPRRERAIRQCYRFTVWNVRTSHRHNVLGKTGQRVSAAEGHAAGAVVALVPM
jgi:hypothetical protein